MDPLTLKLFLAVCEERSIARAAARESITTSAVSKRIADLEAHFGTSLLIRRPQGVEPTAAGIRLLQHCRTMLGHIAEIEHEMRDYRDGVRGLIRVCANESATIGYLPDDIAAFVASHSAVTIDFQVDTSPTVVRKVLENAADVGVFAGTTPAVDLEVFPYRADRLVAVLPSGHALLNENSVCFTDLLDFEMIGSEADGAIESLLRRAASDAGRKLKTVIRVGSFDAACRFVEAGLGYAIVTQAVASTLARALEISFVHLSEDWARRWLNLCVRDRRSLPAASALFVEELTDGRGRGA